MIIIHIGTNDIQKKVNTLQKVRKVITTIKEIDFNNEIQIPFLSVIHRDDQDFEEEIWRIYVRAKGLSSLIILILMVHVLIEANYT